MADMHHVRVTLSADRAGRMLLTAVGALTTLSVLAQTSRHALGRESALGLVPMFDSGAEANLPAWASSLCLLASALLVGGIAAWHRQRGSCVAWRPVAILAAALAFGALDEATVVHEKVGVVFEQVVGDLDGPLRYGWVVPGMAAVALIATYLAPHARRLPAEVRSLAVPAAVLFFGGAIGLELGESAIASSRGAGTAGEDALVVVEECLEMLGASLALVAALRYYESVGLEIRLSP